MPEEIMEPEVDLKQLAKDIRAGKVFHSNAVQEPDMMGMIFLPLALMGPEQAEKLDELKVVLLYEYLDKAGPRSINGYPIFFSFRYLNKEQLDVVVEYIKKLEEAEKAID